MSEEKKDDKKEPRVNPAELPVPEILSVLPLHDFVFYPGMGFPLQVSSTSSKQLIDEALLQERMIAIVSHKKIEGEQPSKGALSELLFSVGVVGYIHKINKTSEEMYQVLVSASKKIRILEYTALEPYLQARVEVIEMKQGASKLVLRVRGDCRGRKVFENFVALAIKIIFKNPISFGDGFAVDNQFVCQFDIVPTFAQSINFKYARPFVAGCGGSDRVNVFCFIFGLRLRVGFGFGFRPFVKGFQKGPCFGFGCVGFKAAAD